MLAVGRPVVLVDVGVGRRDLSELACREIDDGKALLEKRILYLAGCGSFRDEGAGSTRGVFGEEDSDGFAIGRPTRIGEESFYVGQDFCRAGFAASERNAIFWLSGDQATSLSACSESATPAPMRFGGAPDLRFFT